jgi:hypothetical protein
MGIRLSNGESYRETSSSYEGSDQTSLSQVERTARVTRAGYRAVSAIAECAGFWRTDCPRPVNSALPNTRVIFYAGQDVQSIRISFIRVQTAVRTG